MDSNYGSDLQHGHDSLQDHLQAPLLDGQHLQASFDPSQNHLNQDFSGLNSHDLPASSLVYGCVDKSEWHESWGDYQAKEAAHAASQGDHDTAAWKAGLAANEYANAKWYAS